MAQVNAGWRKALVVFTPVKLVQQAVQHGREHKALLRPGIPNLRTARTARQIPSPHPSLARRQAIPVRELILAGVVGSGWVYAQSHPYV